MGSNARWGFVPTQAGCVQSRAAISTTTSSCTNHFFPGRFEPIPPKIPSQPVAVFRGRKRFPSAARPPDACKAARGGPPLASAVHFRPPCTFARVEYDFIGLSATAVKCMAIFYRGAGVGTWWHVHDPRISGFTPQSPGVMESLDRVMTHITTGTLNSPYVSLTRSYPVALSYAIEGRAKPTSSNPAIVWEIELVDPLPANIRLIDPVREVAINAPDALASVPYQHDGLPNCIIGLIDLSQLALLHTPSPMPPGANPPAPVPIITKQLKTLIFALRDSEILALGTLPAACIRTRHEVF